MNTITVEVKDKKLVLPNGALDQLGWRENTNILLEKDNGSVVIRPRELTAKEIARLAGIYLAKYVGDATDVKTPIRNDDKWRVEAVLSYRPQTIGYLTFTAQGELIPEESDSPAKLRGLSRED
ncbi:MAG: hypothetical protein ACREOI_08830 [bacterium]